MPLRIVQSDIVTWYMIYDFYRKLARILAKENSEELFNYIIHAMDDNGGFLRSRYCYWSKELPNRKVDKEFKRVLVALDNPFDLMSSTNYYEDDDVHQGSSTVLKMQIVYSELSEDEKFADAVKWSADDGFPYPIKVDIVNEIVEYCEQQVT